jgi:hypothetical protein
LELPEWPPAWRFIGLDQQNEVEQPEVMSPFVEVATGQWRKIPAEVWCGDGLMRCDVTGLPFYLREPRPVLLVRQAPIPPAVYSPFSADAVLPVDPKDWFDGARIAVAIDGRPFRVQLPKDLLPLEDVPSDDPRLARLPLGAAARVKDGRCLIRSPYEGKVEVTVAAQKWITGARVECLETGRPFWLPAKLPALLASVVRERPGNVLSPSTGVEESVPAPDWNPGKLVKLKGGSVVRLPEKLPELRASLDHVRPGWVASPYTPTDFFRVPAGLWQEGGRFTCRLTGREFVLPGGLPKRVVDAVLAPKLGAQWVTTAETPNVSFPVPGPEWKAGGEIYWKQIEEWLRLPDHLGPLTAEAVPGQPGWVKSPFTAPPQEVRVTPGAWERNRRGEAIPCPATNRPMRLPEGFPKPEGGRNPLVIAAIALAALIVIGGPVWWVARRPTTPLVEATPPPSTPAPSPSTPIPATPAPTPIAIAPAPIAATPAPVIRPATPAPITVSWDRNNAFYKAFYTGIRFQPDGSSNADMERRDVPFSEGAAALPPGTYRVTLLASNGGWVENRHLYPDQSATPPRGSFDPSAAHRELPLFAPPKVLGGVGLFMKDAHIPMVSGDARQLDTIDSVTPCFIKFNDDFKGGEFLSENPVLCYTSVLIAEAIIRGFAIFEQQSTGPVDLFQTKAYQQNVKALKAMSSRSGNGDVPSSLQDWLARRQAILRGEESIYGLLSPEMSSMPAVAGDKVWSSKNAHDYFHKIGDLAVGKKWEKLISLTLNGGAGDPLSFVEGFKGAVAENLPLVPASGLLIARTFSMSAIDEEGSMKLTFVDPVIKVTGQLDEQAWNGELREMPAPTSEHDKALKRLFGAADPVWHLQDKNGKYEIRLRKLSP